MIPALFVLHFWVSCFLWGWASAEALGGSLDRLYGLDDAPDRRQGGGDRRG